MKKRLRKKKFKQITGRNPTVKELSIRKLYHSSIRRYLTGREAESNRVVVLSRILAERRCGK